ncbi:hypothetical protein [Streptomyces avidinii]|uniref:Uncharacterized protein n=1 Tax=Streptomyces avidinii TaxID=1895 RepID=A0ABS4L5B9_STRAV|nr:hypothetical protein [Streptomyces avidinii]MBP2037309.1 hypothetical protein [Streptomyces avidinii]GGY96682.1 hypothetical protein GCM10010343_22900 [Streptomyces avidinii]
MIETRHDELRGFQVGRVRADLRELTVSDDRESMLEGTPHLHRRFRLMSIEKAMAATPHLYVHELDRIRADAAGRVEEWLPREAVHARLTSWWKPEDRPEPGHTELSVMWFQTAVQDPFAHLAAIVRPLDWTSLARFVPFED